VVEAVKLDDASNGRLILRILRRQLAKAYSTFYRGGGGKDQARR
jgi:hypothetical protein